MKIPSPSSPGDSSRQPGLSAATTPESLPRADASSVFRGLVAVALGVGLLRAISGPVPFWLFAGVYFPSWCAAGIVGAPLAGLTVLALRTRPFTRPAGSSLLFFHLFIIYAFLAFHWLFAV